MKSEPRKPLFSVTRDDCEWQTFRAGGPGGQHQNMRDSGVRCIHRPSGAVGEARDGREQFQNRQSAFRRMAETDKFKVWIKMEIGRRLGQPSVDEIVDAAMDQRFLRVEVRDEDGKWKEEA